MRLLDSTTAVARVALLLGACTLAHAGPLNPPAGPITPTHKTLTEVEPRTPISAATTPGDANSLFKITQPGSYYLAGNVAGASGKHGLEIAASNVTVDLNGFALTGVAGSLSGIATEGARSSLVVRGGTVSTWGSSGIDLVTGGAGPLSVVEGVIASTNGLVGIRVTSRVLVRGCIAEGNTSTGISVSSGGTLAGCSANNNTGQGISLGSYGTITDCSARGNHIDGIVAGLGCTVSRCVAGTNFNIGIWALDGTTVTDCSAVDNDSHGLFIGNGCTVTNCASRLNSEHGVWAEAGCLISGCAATANSLDGIRVGRECTVRGCHASDNLVAGVRTTGPDNRIEENFSTNNDRGFSIGGTGNFVARNSASSSFVVNWDVGSGNIIFVVQAAVANGMFGDSGGLSPGSTNPNANYTH